MVTFFFSLSQDKTHMNTVCDGLTFPVFTLLKSVYFISKCNTQRGGVTLEGEGVGGYYVYKSWTVK